MELRGGGAGTARKHARALCAGPLHQVPTRTDPAGPAKPVCKSAGSPGRSRWRARHFWLRLRCSPCCSQRPPWGERAPWEGSLRPLIALVWARGAHVRSSCRTCPAGERGRGAAGGACRSPPLSHAPPPPAQGLWPGPLLRWLHGLAWLAAQVRQEHEHRQDGERGGRLGGGCRASSRCGLLWSGEPWAPGLLACCRRRPCTAAQHPQTRPSAPKQAPLGLLALACAPPAVQWVMPNMCSRDCLMKYTK